MRKHIRKATKTTQNGILTLLCANNNTYIMVGQTLRALREGSSGSVGPRGGSSGVLGEFSGVLGKVLGGSGSSGLLQEIPQGPAGRSRGALREDPQGSSGRVLRYPSSGVLGASPQGSRGGSSGSSGRVLRGPRNSSGRFLRDFREDPQGGSSGRVLRGPQLGPQGCLMRLLRGAWGVLRVLWVRRPRGGCLRVLVEIPQSS